MGTTVVAVLVADDRAALVSVGDSRIYRMRNGALEQLTRDDTWLASVLGEKNAEEADPEHPLRHVLTSVVGTKDDVKPGAREEQLRAGDRFVLCTDGVHGKCDSQLLTSILQGAARAADGAAQLVHEAITRGTTDNATAIVINVA
jgi:serine/threonine protein phosphatase PrpC